MKSRKKAGVVRLAVVATLGALTAAMTLSGCTSTADSSAKTTITLSGPNQFNADTKSFGPAWDKLVAGFEKENPDIVLKTNVLPLSTWKQVSTTQLSAGTAPELIFNQTTHKPNQVVNLDSYLNKPNPYIPGNKKWIDAFDPKYFGGPDKLGVNGNGNHEFIPFNLVGVAIYYNKDILKKENIDPSSLTTFDGFIEGCKTLKQAGYAPLGTDSGTLTQGWEMDAISSTMFDDVVKKLNQFDTSGNPGTANPITSKSIAKGILTNELDLTKLPQVADALKLLKKLNDACATPNWSGIAAAGSFTGGPDFQAGRAAMAWGGNLSVPNLADATFKYGTMPFPTISKSDSPYASGESPEFGTSTGGTSYMIPAYIKGKKLEATIKFLQYVSSPKIQSWLDATGSISAVKGLKAPSGLDAFTEARWSTVPPLGGNPAFIEAPAAAVGTNRFEGYTLGDVSLSDMLTTSQQNNIAWAHEQVKNNGWTDSWAQ